MSRYPLLVMFFMLGLSWLISWLFPMAGNFGMAGKTIGWLLLLLGVALVVVAAGLFKLKGTTVDPTKEPGKLVADGIYRFSRNPMYLGMLLSLVGFQFVSNSVAGFVFPATFFLYVDKVIIPREEGVMEGVFGEAYRKYKSRTRRWI